jgi:hypothetical protein
MIWCCTAFYRSSIWTLGTPFPHLSQPRRYLSDSVSTIPACRLYTGSRAYHKRDACSLRRTPFRRALARVPCDAVPGAGCRVPGARCGVRGAGGKRSAHRVSAFPSPRPPARPLRLGACAGLDRTIAPGRSRTIGALVAVCREPMNPRSSLDVDVASAAGSRGPCAGGVVAPTRRAQPLRPRLRIRLGGARRASRRGTRGRAD